MLPDELFFDKKEGFGKFSIIWLSVSFSERNKFRENNMQINPIIKANKTSAITIKIISIIIYKKEFKLYFKPIDSTTS